MAKGSDAGKPFRSGLLFVCKRFNVVCRDGVYRSDDNGMHWRNVNPVIPARVFTPYTQSLTVNGERIIAGFSEPNVFITTDDGESWANAEVPGGIRATPQKIAASCNYIVGGNPSTATYRSTDNGETWAKVEGLSAVRSIAMKDSIAICYSSSQLFRSTDYGLSWNYVHAPSGNSMTSGAIAISGNKAFAGVGRKMLLSSDAGMTWVDSVYLNSPAINSIVVSPEQSENDYLFVGTDSGGVFRSTDNGLNWTAVNNGLNSLLITSLVFKTQGTDGKTILFAGTGGGLYYSTNFGDSWIQIGCPSKFVVASDGSNLFAVSSNGSYTSTNFGVSRVFDYKYYSQIFLSTNAGVSWVEKYSGYLEQYPQITSLTIAHNSTSGFNLLAGGNWWTPTHVQSYFMAFTSTNQGVDWTTAYNDSAHVRGIVEINSSGILMFTIGNTIPYCLLLRSTDGGITWATIDTLSTFVNAVSSDEDQMFIGWSDLVHIPRSTTKLYQYILNSTNKGATWVSVHSPLDSTKTVSNINTDSLSIIVSLYSSGSHLLVGTRAYNFTVPLYMIVAPAFGGGIYHLVQNGSSWAIADSSLMGRSVVALTASGSNIFAATDSGIFRSVDNGSNWEDISLGMNHIYVQSFKVSDSYLFASTANGLWKRPLSEITSVEVNPGDGELPRQFYLGQNYPNPFNPSTQIKYSIPKNSYGSLKVYNLLGQEVATLFEGVRQSGNYNATFNGKGLASGIYLYRLTANNFTETKKFVLIK